MIVGGVVVETQLDQVVKAVKAQGSVAKRPVNESRSSGGGGALGGLTFGGLGRGGGEGLWTGR